MKFLRWIKFTLGIALSLLLCAVSGFSQGCKSVSIDGIARCGNIDAELRGITTNRLEGRVEPINDLPILINVFKSSKVEWKRIARANPDDSALLVAIQTDKNGKFCHPGLADGYYLVRIGTDVGGFNCTWIKVHIHTGSPTRKINTYITLAT